MDLTGKTVLVVGSGISGVAATELLKKKNVNVVLFDGNKELDLTALREKHPVFADVKIILGELTAEDRSGLDLVVLSPGVPTDLPMVEDLKKTGFRSGARSSLLTILRRDGSWRSPGPTARRRPRRSAARSWQTITGM